MTPALHIIEPTLSDTAGHCHALVMALACAVPEGQPLHIWAAKVQSGAWQGPGRLHAHFHPRWRRWQALWLFRRLLRQGQRVLVATASTTDLLLLDWAAQGQIPPQQAHAFVHWLNLRPSKLRLLHKLALRQPQLRIHAPTAGVVQAFVAAGFDATQVAYPMAPPVHAAATPVVATRAATPNAPATGADAVPSFRHLLVPGGARLDKGFDHIVALVEHLAQQGIDWPLTVQVSREARHNQDTELDRWLARLTAAAYPGLRLISSALSPTDYAALFGGALVLQPYDPLAFADRVSGVTLDALSAGAPTIVPEHTWMARVVRRFGAGEVVGERSPPAWAAAIERAIQAYGGLAQRAAAAAPMVRAEHSAAALMQQVLAPATPR